MTSMKLRGRYMDVSKNRGKTPKSYHFNRVFHYKPSILGAHPYFCFNTHIPSPKGNSFPTISFHVQTLSLRIHQPPSVSRKKNIMFFFEKNSYCGRQPGGSLVWGPENDDPPRRVRWEISQHVWWVVGKCAPKRTQTSPWVLWKSHHILMLTFQIL